MSSQEEELKKKEKLLRDYFTSSKQKLQVSFAKNEALSKAVGDIFEAGKNLRDIQQKEFLNFRDQYQQFFLKEIESKQDNRSRLEFISAQVRELRLKIGNAKVRGELRQQGIYENVINDIVIPIKEELMDMVRLENELGIHTSSNKIKQVEETLAPTLETVTAEIEIEEIKQVNDNKEIFIPVDIIDKPLETKDGKPLNNAKHIAGRRKFIWKDERIPNLIADFLLSQNLIFDYQLQHIQDFFRTANCKSKIVFDGNANKLITLFYELKQTKYLNVSNTFLAERIENIFVRKGDSEHPLIRKESVLAALKPTNSDRRLLESSPHQLKILSYLEGKLKPTE